MKNQPEPFIIAQSTPNPSGSYPPPSSFPILPVGITFLTTLIVLSLWFQRNKLFGWTSSISESLDSKQISSQEFAIDIEALNIRTQDYLRANVKATIYVFIADKDKSNAQEFLVEMDKDSISLAAVESAVKKRAESALRASASEKTLDDLHKKRTEVGQKAKDLLGNCLVPLGLTFRDVMIGEIEENTNYSANNYFDAKALQTRTEVIQPAILATRNIELENEGKIRAQELESEQLIREQELDIGKEIRLKELAIGIELEKEEVNHQKTSLENLKILKEVEEGKIDHELSIELHRNEKEKELQREIEASELSCKKEIETAELMARKEIETAELGVKKDLEFLRNKTEIEIQLDKILNDSQLIDKDKDFQLKQTKVHQEIEKEEIASMIAIIGEEQKRFEKEIDRAKAEESLTTAIEEAKALRQQQQAEIGAASVENEATIIERLARAEEIRFHAIPSTDADRTAQLIRELAPTLIDKLPELAEVVRALAPQPGILGESNTYSFPNGNGEDINKLLQATSGALFLQSLLDGKLGYFLSKSLRSLNSESVDNEHDDFNP